MKKFVALMLAMMLVVGMASVAMAANHGTKDSSKFTPNTAVDSKQTITITKGYTINDADNTTDNHPADTLTFTQSSSAYYINGAVNSNVTVPALTTITASAVTESTTAATISITLPDYSDCPVGEYVYYLTEADAKTAGVTYNYTSSNPLVLKVTLINETDSTTGAPTGNILIGGIALRDGGDAGVNAGNANGSKEKLDSTTGLKEDVHNNYDKGKLTVTKTVTGNMGDTTKPWIFKAEFETTNNETVRGTISLAGSTGTYYGETAPTAAADTGVVTGTASTDTTIVPGTGWTSKTVYFTLKHGQNFVFDNIPEGVKYKVTEIEAAKYDYTTKLNGTATTDGVLAQAEMTRNGDVTAAYVNTKNQTPDTGIALDAVPYVMIMAITLMGAAMMIVRRRKEDM